MQTQEKDIIKYANEVIDNGYKPGILIIDGGWQIRQGVWEFNHDLIPEPKKMVDRLHELGFKVMLWVSPIVPGAGWRFKELRSKGYLVKDAENKTAFRTWWSGISPVMDLSNPDCFKWYTDLFTVHGLEVQADFSNRFRTGEMPVGVTDYTTYCTLEIFAPEIKGLWSFSPLPGTLKEDGTIIAARDRLGRTPVVLGKDADGHCVSFESFAFEKLDYEFLKELGPGEIDLLTPDKVEVLKEPLPKMKICSFLWTYYGYPNSKYEGVNVEVMRTRNGEIMARDDKAAGKCSDIDYVSGVPDSGTPHAIGYANESDIPFARPFIKYTPTWPRSFMPVNQKERNRVAKMKMIPVHELIQGKKLLFVDDSIVRGTQLRETVEFLYSHGAKEVHMRSACPPIMYGCKYLNFSRSNSDRDLIARRTILELEGEEGEKYIDQYSDANTERGKAMLDSICKKLGFHSLGYQSLSGLLEAIGLPEDCVCTYCWNGKE